MATDHIDTSEWPDSYEFDVESLPIPPGTKSRGRLPHGDEPDPIPVRAWWIALALAAAALLAGVVIGRFAL